MKRIILLAGLALAACADPHAPLAPDFGNAVAANMAAQVVNPAPPPLGVAETSGQRLDNAIDRYNANREYQPRLPLAGGRIYDTTQARQQQ
jgi:hypothetical protein